MLTEMIYTINIDIVDLIFLVIAIFVSGLMVGWKFLPPPIDHKKEEIIAKLFDENMAYKIKGLKPKE
jgi:hypothetical protein